MNEYGGLIEKISTELDIKKDVNENVNIWKARVIYSVMGKMAIASLYDVLEDAQSISITHLKRKCQKILLAYFDLYPELKQVMKASPEEFSDEIYNIFLSCGCLYHTPNRLLPATEKRVNFNKIEIVRGAALNEKLKVSGLGTYGFKNGNQDISQLLEMFQIQCNSLEEYGRTLIEKAKWKNLNYEGRKEFLRISPPYSRGYWKDTIDSNGKESLLRIGEKGRYIYYLYKVVGDEILASELPKWMVEGTEYRNVSNALLAVNKALPRLKVERRNYTILLKQEYLLPTALLNFIKLYSWPAGFLNDFDRVMTKDIFEVLQAILNVLGVEVGE